MDDRRLESKLDSLLDELKDLSVNLAKVSVKLEQLEVKYERLSDTPTKLIEISNAINSLSSELARHKDEVTGVRNRLSVLEEELVPAEEIRSLRERLSRLEIKLDPLIKLSEYLGNRLFQILAFLIAMMLLGYLFDHYESILRQIRP